MGVQTAGSIVRLYRGWWYRGWVCAGAEEASKHLILLVLVVVARGEAQVGRRVADDEDDAAGIDEDDAVLCSPDTSRLHGQWKPRGVFAGKRVTTILFGSKVGVSKELYLEVGRLN